MERDERLLLEVGRFLTGLQEDRACSPNTLNAYRSDLEQFAQFIGDGRAAADITRDDVMTYLLWLKQRTYAPTTVARKIAALRSFFRFLVRTGCVEANPTEQLEAPKVDKTAPTVLSREEVHTLLSQPDGSTRESLRDKALLEVLYATGLRVSELVSLNVEDVNSDTGVVRCSRRVLPIAISPAAAQAAADYLAQGRPRLVRDANQPAMFVNHRGDRLTRQGVWLLIKNYARRAAIQCEVTPHTLRHSLATHLLRYEQKELKAIQVLLGHASISTTQMYRHLSPDQLRRVYQETHPRAVPSGTAASAVPASG